MCVLRAFGDEFEPAGFLATSTLSPYSVYKRGDKRFKTGDKVHEMSGLKVEVSKRGFSDRDGQFEDAMAFLRSNHAELQRLVAWPGVECIVLDFPFEAGESMTFVRCPVNLAAESAALNIALEFSLYGRSSRES